MMYFLAPWNSIKVATAVHCFGCIDHFIVHLSPIHDHTIPRVLESPGGLGVPENLEYILIR
jgi:hypothetical protein